MNTRFNDHVLQQTRQEQDTPADSSSHRDSFHAMSPSEASTTDSDEQTAASERCDSPQLQHRRDSALAPLEEPSDCIIGHVTLSGKFMCSHTDCDDLRFGRQADFKRHYENVHAKMVVEYFCPKTGCVRSRNPVGKTSKGRSFKGRKDKMEEHVRTVHGVSGLKRKKGNISESEETSNIRRRVELG
ncbi:hypothetical protein T440DRAFT_276682 [Plenodomus tracheiphilus IPT5]|uniref:C2H2-type domain-containing protein n=1 Tax=Plenodomus tracheiphilus IPT5 TaxID=1408161 RepID=A0A6A7ASR8_9PLEO|nr:hypothetical protein T440DRAFT_276682 [Plenodomus tracheiphilus IPT5]